MVTDWSVSWADGGSLPSSRELRSVSFSYLFLVEFIGVTLVCKTHSGFKCTTQRNIIGSRHRAPTAPAVSSVPSPTPPLPTPPPSGPHHTLSVSVCYVYGFFFLASSFHLISTIPSLPSPHLPTAVNLFQASMPVSAFLVSLFGSFDSTHD